MIDGGATLARRLDRYRSAIRAPTRDAAAPPTDDLAGRLATGRRRRDRPDGRGCHRPSRDPVASPPGRSGPARDAARTAAGGRPARLPRHGDDRAGHGGRHAGLAHRARLVGGGPLPPGPAPACPTTARSAACWPRSRRRSPPTAWLVTYNGRGFDWPLLVARYRLARRAAPVHAGHLDLLPVVRRLFRHRMADARLRTAEAELLGLHRVGDVEGWEIPGRYLEFLRGGPAEPLVDIVRHNDQDVRSLARLLMLIANEYATPEARRTVPIGDLGGLATAYRARGAPRRGPGLLRRRHRRPRRTAATDRPLRAAPCDRGERRAAVVVAPRGGRLRRPTTGADRGRPADPVVDLRELVDARQDRLRTSPPAAPAQALGRGGGRLDESRGGTRSERHRGRHRARQDPRASAARPAGRPARRGRCPRHDRAAQASRPARATSRGRPAGPEPSPPTSSRGTGRAPARADRGHARDRLRTPPLRP